MVVSGGRNAVYVVHGALCAVDGKLNISNAIMSKAVRARYLKKEDERVASMDMGMGMGMAMAWPWGRSMSGEHIYRSFGGKGLFLKKAGSASRRLFR